MDSELCAYLTQGRKEDQKVGLRAVVQRVVLWLALSVLGLWMITQRETGGGAKSLKKKKKKKSLSDLRSELKTAIWKGVSGESMELENIVGEQFSSFRGGWEHD